MAFPKTSDWSEKVYNAGAMGFNLLRDFEKEMHRVYPETQDFNFGYFSETDVNQVSTMGWKHMKGDMFDVEDWNSTVGLRFGLTRDASDNLRYGENYIMLMPRNYRETVIMPARLDAIKKIEAAADEDAVVVHPEDPEFNKMKDAGREIAKTEKVKVQVRGEPDRGEKEPKSDVW
jgi:hypothetical protein